MNDKNNREISISRKNRIVIVILIIIIFFIISTIIYSLIDYFKLKNDLGVILGFLLATSTLIFVISIDTLITIIKRDD